jgi:hypothetical protein
MVLGCGARSRSRGSTKERRRYEITPPVKVGKLDRYFEENGLYRSDAREVPQLALEFELRLLVHYAVVHTTLRYEFGV